MAHSNSYQQIRFRLLDQIADKNNIDERVIAAMKNVPRELFLDEEQRPKAYLDEPLPIIAGQTISQITTVAIQTSLLKLKKGDRVLEIGTGCGYQAAILSELGCHVFTMERQRKLYNLAGKILSELRYSEIELVYDDGFKGLPLKAPFDAILVTCGAPEIPEKLMNQLSIGGRMVVPVGRSFQEMLVLLKTEDGQYQISKAGYFTFVPMLKGVVE